MPDSAPGTFVLASATTAYGIASASLPGAGPWDKAMFYAQAVSGRAVIGAEVYAAPMYAGAPFIYDTIYAGTDSGSNYTSAEFGGAAWVTEASGSATWTRLAPASAGGSAADGSSFLKSVNPFEVPGCNLFSAAASPQLHGKRILQVELHCRFAANHTGNPRLQGYIGMAGTLWAGLSVAAPTNAGWNDLTLGSWTTNPATMLPWTLADVNTLVQGSNLFGFTALWAFQQFRTAWCDGLYLRIKSQAEDRVGYGTTPEIANAGQITLAMKSTPNLLSAQQSSLEAATTAGWTGNNSTLSNSGTHVKDGSHALLCTATAGQFGASTATTDLIPVLPGKTYSAAVPVWVATGAPLTVQAIFNFLDANLNVLPFVGSAGTGVVSNGAWAVAEIGPVAAPLGAVWLQIQVQTTAGAAGNTMYVDGAFVSLDSGAISYTTTPGSFSIPVGGAEVAAVFTQSSQGVTVLRRRSGTGTVSIPTIPPGPSAVGMPLAWSSTRPLLADDAGALIDITDVETDTTALTWQLAGGTTNAGGQPYAGLVYSSVDSFNTVQQQLTMPGAVTIYRLVRFLVSGHVGTPGAPLLVKLKKQSDNSQVGGTATINPADLTGTATDARILTVNMSATATPTAVQHYLEFSSTAALGQGWTVYALDDLVSAGVNGFGGTTDAYNDPNLGGRNVGRDALAILISVPATPTNPTGFLVGTTLQGVEIQWTPTALGASFAAYQVWRNDTGSYVQIAEITSEATAGFADYEGRLGIPASYMVRVERTDGAVSDFTTAIGPFTPEPNGNAYDFTTNELATANYVQAIDIGPRTYTFPERSQSHEFYGRADAVTFKASESEGDQFTIPLLLYMANNVASSCVLPAPVSGRAAFEPIRSLSRAAISYVCIRDSEGNRWYASMTCGDAQRNQDMYTISLSVREASAVPSTPDAH